MTMNKNHDLEPLPSAAVLLGSDELEAHFVGNRLFLAEESYPEDTDFERACVSLSMRCAYELLSWLYSHEPAIRQRAQLESDSI